MISEIVAVHNLVVHFWLYKEITGTISISIKPTRPKPKS